MVNRYMKRCAAPPSIRKIQITTTMRYHFILVKMAITKRQKVSVGKDPEKRESLFTIGRMYIGTTISENSMMPSQRTKNRTTMCSINPGTGYTSRGKGYLSQQGICTPVFPAVLLTVAKMWKLNCPLTKKM